MDQEMLTLPQRQNSFDCGVFMLQTGKHLTGIGGPGGDILLKQDSTCICYTFIDA